MALRQFLSAAQCIVASLATIMLIVAFVQFNGPLQRSLSNLDAMAGGVESELVTSERLIRDVDGVAASLQSAVPEHRKSIIAIRDSSHQVAEAVHTWNGQIDGMQEMATDAAGICNTWADQLPIRVPQVKSADKSIVFSLPEVVPQSRVVEVDVPVATVSTGTKKIPYPHAEVETERFEKGLGEVLNRDLGSISFEYPKRIKISEKTTDIQYPDSIAITTVKQGFDIPASPLLNMIEHKVDVPHFEVEYRELMNDEKNLLTKTSTSLVSSRDSLVATQQSLKRVEELLRVELETSLSATERNLIDVETALESFRSNRIPTTLADLRAQRDNVRQSRVAFSALSLLIPALFVIATLVTLAIAFSGGAKFLSGRAAVQ